jgi:transcription elongation factor GreA
MTTHMNYMTADDKARLEEQLEELKKNRKALSDRIGRARELGDLRENAEYHSAKEDQGHNERKIRDIEEKLAGAVVVDDASWASSPTATTTTASR